MRLKTPRFWYGQPSAASFLLQPLSWLYACGHALHQKLGKPYRSSVPVICIGNLVAGGSGKTPAALAVMNIVRTHGIAGNPCFLTRGYGGALTGPVLADPARHKASDVGDEPLLLARAAPAIVSRDRASGARFAEQNGFDLIVMDDGLQNPSLEKNVRIVVVDGATGFGNRKMLPAGPLRTPLSQGLNTADAFIVIDGAAGFETDKPVFSAAVQAQWDKPPSPYVAFCGIGQPDKFFRSLERAGVRIEGRRIFPDHHIYSPGDLKSLADEARAKKTRLVTTQKDHVKIQFVDIEGVRLDVFSIELEMDEKSVAAFLMQRLKKQE